MSSLISVIVPVYKAEKYLSSCVTSILQQTHTDLEVILIDDESPDQCPALCDQFAAMDQRVRVIHQKNSGAYAARNAALDIIKGDYVGFVDADDWIDPSMYEQLLSLIESTGAAIAQCEMINEGQYQQIRGCILGKDTLYTQDEILPAFFTNSIAHGLINKLFRADLWRDFRFSEDYYHMDAAALTVLLRSCHSFIRTDMALYHYNTQNQSITRGPRNLKHLASMETLFDAYSTAARYAEPEGDFFICQEIPSHGRLILPGTGIPLSAALSHQKYMHRIFKRHWNGAKHSDRYADSPPLKRLLWHLYYYSPSVAAITVYVFSNLSRGLRHQYS